MSLHELIVAAYVEDLRASTKLVLMAVADSSDEHTREAAPGLPKLRAWSGLGRSQTLKVVGELCTRTATRPAYLEQLARGRVGRRALYRVFPAGLPPIPTPAEIAARYELSTGGDNPVEGPADWTLDLVGEGPISGIEGPAQTGPLHAFTSVSSARAPRPRRTAPVDSGFPGARSAPPADPRTGRGFHDVPCPLHPAEVQPCRLCAVASLEADPVKVAAAKAAVRAATRGHRAHPS